MELYLSKYMTTPKTYTTSQKLTTNQNAAMHTIQTSPVNRHYYKKVQVGNGQEKGVIRKQFPLDN